MSKTFKLEIYTPYRLFFSGEVEAVVVMLADGEIGIYADRQPFTAPVRVGIIKVRYQKKDTPLAAWYSAFTAEGVIEVKKHKTVLLADAAEWPEEIDRQRATEAKNAALKTLSEDTFKFESLAAGKHLARAEARLKALGEI
jgi:F-type H+-transporting ATPase subunit epsilon